MEKIERLSNILATNYELEKDIKEYFNSLDIEKILQIALNNNAKMREKLDKIKSIQDDFNNRIKEGYYE